MKISKTAVITIIGRPNVGKSTLANAIAGEKVAIVSHKPQTTRNRIYAVRNFEDTQLVFVDTPGFHKPKNQLGNYMVKVVRESVSDVEACLLVVEPIAHIGEQEEALLQYVRKAAEPVFLVINKIDTVKKEELLAVMATYSAAHTFDHIVPISAKTGEGVAMLEQLLCGYAIPGEALFPEDMVTDQPDRQIVAELIREKLLLCLEHEIPHGTAVEITRFSQRDNGIVDVEATIYCEKDSHKGIIIGKQGTMLKNIGQLARRDIERFMGEKVYLQTVVKVKENWRQSQAMLRSFGYEE